MYVCICFLHAREICLLLIFENHETEVASIGQLLTNLARRGAQHFFYHAADLIIHHCVTGDQTCAPPFSTVLR